MIPRATYRVQFHSGFTFADAIPLAPYWAELGVSHVYASPIATARAGSMHGYDVVDPTRINPHLGGEDGFAAMVAALRAQGLGVILDIVPNHLAVGGQENGWWLDVLENGRASPHARTFDIDWSPGDPELEGRILAPFLGVPYAEALAAGALTLDVEAETGRLSVLAHGTHRFPIRPQDYPELLGSVGVTDVRALDFSRLAAVYDARKAGGRERLHALLERQHYRLAWWRSAGDRINWRRFFDITELAGLRIEDPAVFDAVHALPLRLYADGLVDGLRVDHVDGLADPAGYCRRLRRELDARSPRRPQGLPNRAWLVVEKILGADEKLAADWGVDGTTGYDFMETVSAVLHAPQGAAPLTELWAELSGRPAEFEIEEDQAREEILGSSFAGQLDATAGAFQRLATARPETRDFGLPAFRRAAATLIGKLSVYRTYAGDGPTPATDAPLREAAVEKAVAAAPNDADAIRLIDDWLAARRPAPRLLRADAVRRFQQLSAPIAAKAVEDTAFYRYGRLLSRNDVGFDPKRFALSPADFLNDCARRSAAFPNAMLATATHDHKRGEDVRARLAVLSEIPDLWARRSRSWVAAAHAAGLEAVDALMLFQTVVGAWPLDLGRADGDGLRAFSDRVQAWQVKALREAKLRSSWVAPIESYEAACTDFTQRLFTGDDLSEIRAEIGDLVEAIGPAAVAKSLVQVALHLTAPGVPDIYQGCEHWDFSLVDPDNRRPVNYQDRRAGLAAAPHDWRDPRAKQALIADLLAMRRAAPGLFAEGALEVLPLRGARAGSALAFRRRSQEAELLVICALHAALPCIEAKAPTPSSAWWADTLLEDGGGLHSLAQLMPDTVVLAQLSFGSNTAMSTMAPTPIPAGATIAPRSGSAPEVAAAAP